MSRYSAFAIVLAALTAATAAHAAGTKPLTLSGLNPQIVSKPDPAAANYRGAMHNNMMPVIAHPAFSDPANPFYSNGSGCAYCTGHDGGVGQPTN